MTIEALHQLLQTVADRRLSRAFPLYELSGGFLPFTRRWRTLSQRQVRFFEALVALPWDVYLNAPEHPMGFDAPGTWRESGEGAWHLPMDVPADRLLAEFLHAGGWSLYLGHAPVAPASLPDLYAADPAVIFGTLATRGIYALLAASHGNREWRGALQPAVVPGLAAA